VWSLLLSSLVNNLPTMSVNVFMLSSMSFCKLLAILETAHAVSACCSSRSSLRARAWVALAMPKPADLAVELFGLEGLAYSFSMKGQQLANVLSVVFFVPITKCDFVFSCCFERIECKRKAKFGHWGNLGLCEPLFGAILAGKFGYNVLIDIPRGCELFHKIRHVREVKVGAHFSEVVVN
jgi:hypothetical protein